MIFQYVCFNDQLGVVDCANVCDFRYDGPDNFEDGKMADAEAFLKAEAEWYGYEEKPTIKYWDGRTMVVDFLDGDSASVQTYVFEAV